MKRIFLFTVTNLAVLVVLGLVYLRHRARIRHWVKWTAKRHRNLPRPQVEAVLGHEISHVANGDRGDARPVTRGA